MKEMRLRKNRTRRGSMLVDALTGLFILSIGCLSLFATLPVAHKASKMSQDQAQATTIATKYIEQLQTLKTTDLTLDHLNTVNLIDAGQSGSSPYTFTKVPLDDGSYYSPFRTLKGAAATVQFTNIDSSSVLCKIVISWKSPAGKTETLTTGTIIGGYK